MNKEIFAFDEALRKLKQGYKLARLGWNGKGIYIGLQEPTENSPMTRPHLYIDTSGLQTDNPNAPLARVPWIPSQTDILAEDFHIYD